ncbi:CWF19-like protein 1 isoform X2 [Battus philenor]|uniref:CWF19-like protein 1 isoform X2 n=1 Tax=Battus philenor TaxID=42288 RepID=UPI0035D10450
MCDKQKTLICGDVNGNFNALFSRVESIVKKSGPFDVLICVGNFFGDDNSQLDAYKMGTRKVPVTTYVFGPSNENHVQYYCEEGSEIIPNVIYMGKRGIFTTSSDVKIAYLTGLSRRELGKDVPMCTFEPSDCSAVRDACLRGQSEYRGVDILITTLWPVGIEQDDCQKMNVKKECTSDLISWLAIHIKPRYHFVPSTDKYYERQPYRNQSIHQDYRECATRFIGLAPVGNKVKEKWIYACSLQPISKMRMTDLLQATTDETMCPYDPELMKQHQPGKVVKVSGNGQFFYNLDAADDDQGKRKRKGGENPERKRKEFDPDTCWFCLSSPTVEKHLVICVGTHCYLALPKGPLTPYHVLILPIAHHQAASKDEAGINSIQIEVLPPYADIAQVVLPGSPYFHAELPSGDQIFAKTKQYFPLQFGRDVLSSPPILNCEDKADWRQCLISREEEDAHVATFRRMFRPFDFNVGEDSDSDSS